MNEIFGNSWQISGKGCCKPDSKRLVVSKGSKKPDLTAGYLQSDGALLSSVT
jgi:hypothetical protein